ncbi:MurR/RpiR family transcriptional regulator [Pseudalkalibacillus sp. R45]|uniref:MurR/RpiR family transcriptional regulator n=1 Tax=Pseudalkalibacillus sp. R45 TaxID=3457433 RepID=UPI003FCD778C
MGVIVDHFSQALPSLTHSEKHVLYHIENNFETAKNQSLTQMAEAINVSTTTIVRMCHKLGLAGFSELKYTLKTFDLEDELPESTPAIDRYISGLNTTLQHLGAEHFYKVSEMMTDANRVVIVGVGLSKMMGEYFSKLLMQVNKPTFYTYESHIIDLLPNMIEECDLVVFISSSGETKTLVDIAEKLKFANHTTLAITNAADSTLAKLASYSLSGTVKRVQYAGYDLTARSTLLVIIDILFEFFLKEGVEGEDLK